MALPRLVLTGVIGRERWGENLHSARIWVVSFLFWCLLLPGRLVAAEGCAPVVGRVMSVDGQMEVQRRDNRVWQPIFLNETVCERDAIRTGLRSRAAVMLINDAVLRLDQETTIHLVDIVAAESESSLLSLVRGAFQSFSRSPREMEINTPYVNATIEGTEFLIRAEARQAQITVFEGIVAAANAQGRVRVSGGHSVTAAAGQPPKPYTLVRPRDSVQWALYYPPIDAALGGRGGRIPATLPPRLRAALKLASQNNKGGALAELDRVPVRQRGARFYHYQAAFLLSVGRVDEARAAIDRALKQNPKLGLAYALRAIIAVVQNKRDAALADAQRAVALEPRASAPKIALSYVQQAHFELEAARDTLLQAIEAQPQDALAWARLAEVWLMLGYRDRARQAAERAAGLAPNLERVQVVRGFTALAEIRTKEARQAFEKAIALDSADPQPRFGLGLATIRDGDLEAGRRDIEVAVGLDSSNSLLRSYLGKAYFEERRPPLDAQQLAIAKELDPLDPTPYLYDAIRKQSENQPVAALQDIQTSIRLNDNRAIYRSRQALDQDRAARGASLGRIYDDLGFDKLGENEGSKSLTSDPANASAHRFLSDIYLGARRRESARVSELLQAQLLQDININPIQPSLSETNLNVATRGGPADPGFNEFTPLFERNDVQLVVSGLAGNDDTFGTEGVASAIYDQFSISGGGFYYETDAWRPNADIQHHIENLFVQAAVTPELNVQAEFRHRESEHGDLAMNFDPDSFDPNFRRDLNQDMGRVGLRFSPSPHSDLLLSAIYSDRDENQTFADSTAFAHDKGYQLEAQYIHEFEQLNVIAGLGYTNVDSTVGFTFDPFPPIILNPQIEHLHGYVYSNIKIPDSVTWTVGVSADDYSEDSLEVREVNPKFGVQWQITDDVLLRGAAFRAVKPALVSNRTIEPTQVAGFTQLFDDGNADQAWRYGVGLDWRLTDRLFVGAEATWRDLTIPVFGFDNRHHFEDQQEQLHRSYIYWTPTETLALSAQLVYDRFEAEPSGSTESGTVPEDLETISVPLAVRYFHGSGFFAGAGVTYVNQRVERSATAKSDLGLTDGHDEFFVVDAALGWRFPERRGIASLSVNNLFDQKFRYQDDSFREFRDEPSTGPYIPALQVVGRLTLNF
jgi:tetratricopeptide (TPR) repeat protein